MPSTKFDVAEGRAAGTQETGSASGNGTSAGSSGAVRLRARASAAAAPAAPGAARGLRGGVDHETLCHGAPLSHGSELALPDARIPAMARRSSAPLLFDLTGRGAIVLTGKDRASFLHGPRHERREEAPPGEGCAAAFLTPKGKMLADARRLSALPRS